MRSALLLFAPLLLVQAASAQKTNTSALQGANHSKNIEVQPLFGDSLVNSFYIEIQNDVPAHFHRYHSEHVYVLSGHGEMQLADSSFSIQAGDFIFIPKGTPHRVQTTGAEPLRVISIQAPRFEGKDRIPID